MQEFLLNYYSIIFIGIVAFIVYSIHKRPEPISTRENPPTGRVRRIAAYVADRLGLTLNDAGIRYTRGPLYAFHMGERFEGVGEQELAIGYFAQAVEGSSEWAEARYRLAMCYIRSRQFDKAKPHFAKLEELNGDLAALVKEHLPAPNEKRDGSAL